MVLSREMIEFFSSLLLSITSLPLSLLPHLILSSFPPSVLHISQNFIMVYFAAFEISHVSFSHSLPRFFTDFIFGGFFPFCSEFLPENRVSFSQIGQLETNSGLVEQFVP